MNYNRGRAVFRRRSPGESREPHLRRGPFSGVGRRRANGFFAAAGLVLSLMLLRRRFVPAYLLSFVVGFVFGKLLDLHKAWIDALPATLPLRVLYFVFSYVLLAIGKVGEVLDRHMTVVSCLEAYA